MSRTRELLSCAQLGDATAFAELVRRYEGLVFAACFEQTGHFADSEDLAQEVLLVARRSVSSLEQPEKLAAWLRGIARNLCRMHQRRSRRETIVADEHDLPEEAADATPSLELQNLLHDALTRVSDRSREVLSLHYLGGYSYEEIGELCDMPVRLVRSRLHEGRAQLKSRLLDLVANLCRCSRDAEHTARCSMERCGVEACGCVTRLIAL